jgi:hypothetical protein
MQGFPDIDAWAEAYIRVQEAEARLNENHPDYGLDSIKRTPSRHRSAGLAVAGRCASLREAISIGSKETACKVVFLQG